MNTSADIGNGASGTQPRPPGQTQANPGDPQAIHMTMPEHTPESATNMRGDPQERVEALLNRLMVRLDENDRQYNQALDVLYNGLNTISEQAGANESSIPAGPAAPLDRVRDQASSLAAQVQDASAAHRVRQTASLQDIEKRLERYAGRHEGGLSTGAGAGPDEKFADLAKQLDSSLAVHAPGSDFDMLARRMDDLGRHFDAALAAKDDSGTLRTIEALLKEITTAFANAKQHFSRIEAIEGHVLSLMNWAKSANAPGKDGDTEQRPDAMNDTLDSLAAHIESSPGSRDGVGNAFREAGASAPPQAGGAPHGGEEYAEVFINKGPESQSGYQSTPAVPGQPGITQTGAGDATARGRQNDSVEPSFDADNDWVASARRAAAATAAQAPPPGPDPSRRARANVLPNETTPYSPPRSKRPRAAFVAAAVCLLLISAGILLMRLQDRPDVAAIGTFQKGAPMPPVSAPETPADAGQRSSLPDAKKQHSERLLTGQPEASGRQRAAPLAIPPPAPAPAAKPLAPAPVRKAQFSVPPQQSVSTATILASLTQKADPEQLSGVQMSITPPSLVPNAAFTQQPNPLPQPKRMRTPDKTNHQAGVKTSVPDSAPASESTLPMPSRQAAMPPARIGPQSLRMAAARGNPAAQTEVASRFAKGTGVDKNLKKAAEWYGRAAAQSFAPAQYRLGALHERGLGVKKDIALARTWYRRAAEQGNIRAMHNLAVLYTRTDAKGQDYTSAKNWFHEAARHGLADSQFNLGILYESGLGATKNAAEAYKWFTLAARQGDTEAVKRRELVRVKLSARSLSAVERTLKLWTPAKVNQAANKTGQPRGGWQTARAKEPASAPGPQLIAQAQYLLNKLGYDAGLPDGKLGPKTVAAIHKFEARSGGAKSGRVTPTLLRKLEAKSG